MKCRNLIKNNDKQNIVWFGSYGIERKIDTTKLPQKTLSITYQNGLAYWDIPEEYYTIENKKFEMNAKIILEVLNVNELPPSPLNYIRFDLDFLKNGRIQTSLQYSIYYNGKGIFKFVLEDFTKVFPTDEYCDKVQIGFFSKPSPPFVPSPLEANLSIYLPENYSLKADNYVGEQHGVAVSLIQRLSIIKGELWYKASYGLPLLDKIKNKGIYDSIIINIINSHPDVENIVYYNSKIENHSYIFNFIVRTIYGEDVEINYML